MMDCSPFKEFSRTLHFFYEGQVYEKYFNIKFSQCWKTKIYILHSLAFICAEHTWYNL